MYTQTVQLVRVNVGLMPDVHAQLLARAIREGRPLAAMAARLITGALDATNLPRGGLRGSEPESRLERRAAEEQAALDGEPVLEPIE